MTDAELVRVVPDAVSAGSWTTTESTGRLAPTARVSVGLRRVQSRVAPDAAHDHPVPVADTSETPAGSVSVTRNGPTATSGPRLVTATRQVASAPATTGSTWVLSSTRSAESMRVLAVAAGPEYGPVAFPFAPDASTPVPRALFTCGTDAPTPGLSTTVGVGTAE